MQLYSTGTSYFACAPRPLLIATRDPRRAQAVLLAQGLRASYVDAVTAGVAVLTDPYKDRAWKFNMASIPDDQDGYDDVPAGPGEPE